MGLVPFPDHSWQKLVEEFHLTHFNCLFKVDYCMSAFSSKTTFKQLCLMARVKKRGSIFQQQKVSDFFHFTFHCKTFRRKQNPRSGYSGFRSITGYAFPHKNGLVRTRTYLFPPSLADLARWILGIVVSLFCYSPTNGDGLFLTSAQKISNSHHGADPRTAHEIALNLEPFTLNLFTRWHLFLLTTYCALTGTSVLNWAGTPSDSLMLISIWGIISHTMMAFF